MTKKIIGSLEKPSDSFVKALADVRSSTVKVISLNERSMVNEPGHGYTGAQDLAKAADTLEHEAQEHVKRGQHALATVTRERAATIRQAIQKHRERDVGWGPQNHAALYPNETGSSDVPNNGPNLSAPVVQAIRTESMKLVPGTDGDVEFSDKKSAVGGTPSSIVTNPEDGAIQKRRLGPTQQVTSKQ